MFDIRLLRRSRGLTLTDLAQLSGIPVRVLAEIEHGLRRLDADCRRQLALTLGVPAQQLGANLPAPPQRRPWPQLVAGMLVALALVLAPVLWQAPAAAQPSTTPAPTLAPATPAAPAALARAARPAPGPAAPTAPPATATPAVPRFTLAADGPRGCPLAPAAGRVVMTQGYAEGTHAPSAIWGGVDLAIDGDGDGEPEPPITQGQPIAASLGGVAHVYLGTWPAGNYVRVTDERSGWAAAYAHLDTVAVQDGQAVRAGDLIGSVGSTGMTSGPHLHYEIWRGQQNVDPTGLIGCN